jgi:hypothetical protein
MLTFYSPSASYNNDGNHIVYLVHLYGKHFKDVKQSKTRVNPKGRKNGKKN